MNRFIQQKLNYFVFTVAFLSPLQAHDDDSPKHLIQHLRIRSAKGEAQATYLLATEYTRGKILVKNDEKALRLFHQAAQAGSAAAQLILSEKYFEGKGVKMDKIEAYKWVVLSAEQGSKVARAKLTKFGKFLSLMEKKKGQNLADEWQANFQKSTNEVSK